MMRKEDFLNEMPIRVHNINVNRDDDTSSFGADDRALLHSDKAIRKIKRVWNSSVAEVDLYTLDVNVGPDTALDIALGYHTELSDEDNERISGLRDAEKIEFDPNAISVVLSNNSGTSRLPLTGWIIAHRLYHCFQNERVSNIHTANWLAGPGRGPNIVKMLEKISEQFAGIMFDLENYCIPRRGYNDLYLNKLHRACLIGSSKACRDIKLTSYLELLPECFAQYMLRGNVKLRTLSSEPFEIDSVMYTPSLSQYKYCVGVVVGFERFLNEKFAELIKAARGRVVAI